MQGGDKPSIFQSPESLARGGSGTSARAWRVGTLQVSCGGYTTFRILIVEVSHSSQWVMLILDGYSDKWNPLSTKMRG